MRHLSAKNLAPPRVKQPAGDGVFASDLSGGQIGAEALHDDLALLLGCPNPAAFAARDELDTWTACALMPTPFRVTFVPVPGRARLRCEIERFCHRRSLCAG